MSRATVITDASFCPDLKVGGYGCWIAADGIKNQGFSGPIQIQCANSYEAELMAAAIGVTIANQTFGVTDILLQSDCEGVRNLLRDAKIRKDYIHHLDPIPALRFKHVKGHTKRKEPRFWVNRWCDREAGFWMRKERNRYANRNPSQTLGGKD